MCIEYVEFWASQLLTKKGTMFVSGGLTCIHSASMGTSFSFQAKVLLNR